MRRDTFVTDINGPQRTDPYFGDPLTFPVVQPRTYEMTCNDFDDPLDILSLLANVSC